MLRYDIDPTQLEVENQDLVRLNAALLGQVETAIQDHIAQLERATQAPRGPSTPQGLSHDEKVLQERFQLLVAMAVQYGLDASDIASQLGITMSTVHRWAKGTFVPPQVFVRAGALRGILRLLTEELKRLDTTNSFRQQALRDKYTPHIVGVYNAETAADDKNTSEITGPAAE